MVAHLIFFARGGKPGNLSCNIFLLRTDNHPAVAILCFLVKLIKFFFFISVYFVFIFCCLPFMVNKR